MSWVLRFPDGSAYRTLEGDRALTFPSSRAAHLFLRARDWLMRQGAAVKSARDAQDAFPVPRAREDRPPVEVPRPAPPAPWDLVREWARARRAYRRRPGREQALRVHDAEMALEAAVDAVTEYVDS